MHYVAWRIAAGGGALSRRVRHELPRRVPAAPAVVRTLGTRRSAWRLFDLALARERRAGGRGLCRAVGTPGRRRRGALLLVLYHLSGGAWQAGQRDFLLCPLLLLGALGVARWMERGRRAGVLAWGGLALGASMTIKPHTRRAAAGLGVMSRSPRGGRRGVARAARLLRLGRRRGRRPASSFGWRGRRAAGLAPPWSSSYLVPLYSHVGLVRAAPRRLSRLASGIPAPAASCSRPSRARPPAVRAPATRWRPLGVLSGALHFVAQGKGWEYHLYPLAAFALVLRPSRSAAELARPGSARAVDAAAFPGAPARGRARALRCHRQGARRQG